MQTNYSRLESIIIILYVMFLFWELGAVASNKKQKLKYGVVQAWVDHFVSSLTSLQGNFLVLFHIG
jgi:hypothetical protein